MKQIKTQIMVIIVLLCFISQSISVKAQDEIVNGVAEEVVEEEIINDVAEEVIEEEIINDVVEDEIQEEPDAYVKATDLDLADFQSEMEVGQRQLLIVTVLPINATDKSISFFSSNNNIATVNELGRITALNLGTTVITITTADNMVKQLELKVISPPSTFVAVEEIDFGEYINEMRVGESRVLTTSVYPYNATNTKIQYKSSDTQVATISKAGRITAITKGKTIISAQSGGKTASFTLEVLPENKIKEVDLGDYRKEMFVDESQLIMPAIFPADAINSGFSYKSSRSKVASINGLGRIVALTEGTTTITVLAGDIKKQFKLTVKIKKDILATEIDLGDYRTEINIGDSHIIMPSVLPREANGIFEYASSNTTVATINGFGRILGISTGETEISIITDDISRSYILTVNEKVEKDVQDIEIGAFEEEIEVGKTQRLTATVVPQDAEDAKISYSSSNEAVATINSSGEIEALDKGKTVITVKAGEVIKHIDIVVVVKTTKIDINQTFLVLKTGDSFQIEAKVLPIEAKQQIVYKSTNPSIATVDEKGLIIMKSAGEVAIVLSNGYLQAGINIIVVDQSTQTIEDTDIAKQLSNSDRLKDGQQFNGQEILINSIDIPIITSDLLKHLYDSKGQLIVEGHKYRISLQGKDVLNFNNEVVTDLAYSEEDDGIVININGGKNLPGKVTITFLEAKVMNARYLYLFNETKNKYELFNNLLGNGIIETNLAGKYLLVNQKIDTLSINLVFSLLALISILIVAVLYIVTKRKYWFW